MSSTKICIAWFLVISGVYAQSQYNAGVNRPLDSSVYNREFTNGDDAIEMGRTAAEDMGALMASPPVNIFRVNQGRPQTDRDKRLMFSQNNFFPQFARGRESSPDQVNCVEYDLPNHELGRSSKRTVTPMSWPLVPLLPSTSPLSLPGIPPLATPIIQALLPGLSPARRRLLPPRLPPLRVPRIPGLQPLGRSAYAFDDIYQQYIPNNYFYYKL